MPKKLPRAIDPFYRAVFPLDTIKTADGYEVMDKDWGRAIGFVLARHRCSHQYSPYGVPNEYICARLGTAIGLPIPPFALSKHSDGARRLLFSSLDFNPAGLRLPPILPDVCMEHLPSVCAGIITFDVWVANEDRHDMNLAVDKTLKPKLMRVYDHDMALFGGCKLNGIPRLDALTDLLAITDRDVTGGSEHCLLPYLKSSDYLESWVKRVQSVPKWLIVEACTTMVKQGISKEESKVAIAFLLHRQSEIRKLIFGLLCTHCQIQLLGHQKASTQRSLFDFEE